MKGYEEQSESAENKIKKWLKEKCERKWRKKRK